MQKSVVKKYINQQKYRHPVQVVMEIMECRAEKILKRENSKYKEMYIDPNVEIVNSNPQVIQQVREELQDFLFLLYKLNVKNIIQIGLGHWASTHFALSLLLDTVLTIEYDKEHVDRYSPEMCPSCDRVIHADSLEYHKYLQNDSYDALFIDGNHSYEYVKKDLENYSPKVKPGGVISLHDVNFEGDRYGTPKVLRESGQDWTFISHSKEVGIAYRIKESS